MNNPQKSWKGIPTTNLVNPSWASWSVDGSGHGTIGTRTITSIYECLINDNAANTRQNIYILGIAGSTTYTFSVQYKKVFGSPTLRFQLQSYNGGTFLGSVFPTTVQLGITDKEGWQTAFYSYTTAAGADRVLWFMQDGDDYTAYDHSFILANAQCEAGSIATPFVAGTRFANNNLESTPSFPSWNTLSGSSASGGTLTFASGSYNNKSGWDLYKTYSGLTAGVNYTWSALVKSGTASNLIVTMNNGSAWNTGPGEVFAGFSSTEWRRIYITGTTNTGTFNIHLGASFNNELQNTVQTGGTIFIQDVSLRLTNSQTAISDVTGNNSAIAGNLVYNSDGTFQFSYANPSYIQIPNSFLNKTEGTMNFWVYPTRYNGGNGYFVNREDSGANAVDWFWIGPYSDSFYFRIGNGSDCCSNDLSFGPGAWSVIPLNTWTNMCFTWKINGTSAIYKNGALYTSRSIGNIPNTNPASNGRIGLGHGNADDYFNGIMPTVSIYNRQLSANEINQNFNAQRGRYGI
jgi:hypothetical protein